MNTYSRGPLGNVSKQFKASGMREIRKFKVRAMARLFLLTSCLIMSYSSMGQSFRSLEETARRESRDRTDAFTFRMRESFEDTSSFVRKANVQIAGLIDDCWSSRKSSTAQKNKASIDKLGEMSVVSSDLEQSLKLGSDLLKSRLDSVTDRINQYCTAGQAEFGLWLDCLLRHEKRFFLSLVVNEAQYIHGSAGRMRAMLPKLESCLLSDGNLAFSQVMAGQEVLRLFREKLDGRMETLSKLGALFMEN